jgi:hypothetical protein
MWWGRRDTASTDVIQPDAVTDPCAGTFTIAFTCTLAFTCAFTFTCALAYTVAHTFAFAYSVADAQPDSSTGIERHPGQPHELLGAAKQFEVGRYAAPHTGKLRHRCEWQRHG